MLVLRQSTSIDIRMGPFVDATDGVTPETGVTLAGADQAEVLKANGAATTAMAGTFAAVTGAGGWYDYTVATGDVNTVGEVVFVVQDSSLCLPVLVRAQVVEETVFDALFAASAAGFASISALAAVDANVDAILVDTSTTLDGKINTIDTNVDSILVDTAEIGAAGAGLTALATAANLATVDTNVDSILVDTATTIPAQITALNDFNPATDAVANVTLVATTTTNTDMRGTDSANTATPPTSAAISDAVWDELLSGHAVSGSTGEALSSAGTAGDPWTTALPGAYGAGTAGNIIGNNIDAPISTVDANVDAILADTNELQVNQGDWATATSVGLNTGAITSSVVAANALNNSSFTTGFYNSINAEVDTALADYDGPTNAEMVARTLLAADYFDPAADTVANVTTVGTTTTNTDMRGTDSAATASALATAQSDLDIITGATGVNLLAATQASIDAIELDTATAIPAQITALNDVSAADILNFQIAESYAADGVAPTLAQALMLIQQNLGDFSISGTTITVRQLDGSTTAATYTLDDGTSPTSKTRST